MGDRFGRFGYRLTISITYNVSVGNQVSKVVTNIEILVVTNITIVRNYTSLPLYNYLTLLFSVMEKVSILCFIRIINRKWLHKVGKSDGLRAKSIVGINFTKKILSPGYFLDYDLLPVAASSRFVLFEDL